MNDRAVSLLEKYELTVNRTWKGRGAILCDTDQGLKILMEYPYPKERIILQDTLLEHIKEAGDVCAERIVRNRDGELLCVDMDQTAYVLKDYFQGQECGVRDVQDCKRAVKKLAQLHRIMYLPAYCAQNEIQAFSLSREFEKRTRELKKVHKFLQCKGQRGEFELYLLHCYKPFYEKAKDISLRLQEEESAAEGTAGVDMRQNEAECASGAVCDTPVTIGAICHGDFQYHNVLFQDGKEAVVHFERCVADSQMRDLCLFLRKVLEKNNWDMKTASILIEEYDKEKTMTSADKKQLYYRFAYPEKFWKIVNFYYNNGKAWIPEKNKEKLQRVLEQEENREAFLRTLEG